MKLFGRFVVVGAYCAFLGSLGYGVDSLKFWIGMVLFITYGAICHLDQ